MPNMPDPPLLTLNLILRVTATTRTKSPRKSSQGRYSEDVI